MKIVIVQGAFLPVPPILGGAVEKIWFELGKEFARLGHNVTHISKIVPNTLVKEELIEGVKHCRVKGYSTPSSGVILKLFDLLYTRRAIKKIPEDVDIIVSNTFWTPILLEKKRKKSAYVSVERMPKGQMKFYLKSGRLRANSSSVVTAIRAEIPQDFYNKITLVPNPLPFVVNAASGICRSKEKTILYVGRIHPEKGLEILIKAFSTILTDWQLVIVGSAEIAHGGGGDDYLNKLKSLSDNSNAHIQFVGPVYDIVKLNDFYKRSSIFVYPSVADRGETFGLAPLEAMAWGCVPVVSNIACFKDFITDQVNGCIFDYHNPNCSEILSNLLLQLINSEGLRLRLGERALQVNISHSIHNIAKLFLDDFVKMKN